MILNNTLITTGGGGSDNIRTPIIYSYVGTGKCGPDHPNIITLDFEPVFIQTLLQIHKTDSSKNMYFNPWDTNSGSGGKRYIITASLTTSYQLGKGLQPFSSYGSNYGKKSEDSKTIYWYVDSINSYSYYQFNDSDYTYYLLIY